MSGFGCRYGTLRGHGVDREPDRTQSGSVAGGSPAGADAGLSHSNNWDYYASAPTRTVNRHQGRGNLGFVDGHVVGGRVSTIGLQFMPGVNGATGSLKWGGNGLTDPRRWWDRE